MQTVICEVCKASVQVEPQLGPGMMPMPPIGMGTVSVSVACNLPGQQPVGAMLWHGVCPNCALRFQKNMQDPVVATFITNMIPWFVRQSFDLKVAIDKTRAKIHPEN